MHRRSPQHLLQMKIHVQIFSIAAVNAGPAKRSFILTLSAVSSRGSTQRALTVTKQASCIYFPLTNISKKTPLKNVTIKEKNQHVPSTYVRYSFYF